MGRLAELTAGGFVWTAMFRPANVLSLSREPPSRPNRATRSVARSEARKRRANKRPRVGCCEELGGSATRPVDFPDLANEYSTHYATHDLRPSTHRRPSYPR